jgi:hypothetical protein
MSADLGEKHLVFAGHDAEYLYMAAFSNASRYSSMRNSTLSHRWRSSRSSVSFNFFRRSLSLSAR